MANSNQPQTGKVDTDYGQNGSIARDLGEQYRDLLDTQELELAVGDDKATVLVVPQGRRIESIKKYLDEYRAKPERRKGTVTALSIDSFIKIVNRFESDESIVFANPGDGDAPTFTAVFDYHPSGADATDADWLQHRAQFAPRLSDEWQAWDNKDGVLMPQREFAAFIEERISNIIVPNLDDPKIKKYAELLQGSWAEPTDLVALSRGIEMNVGIAAKNAVRLSSGEVQITYTESHQDGSGQPLRVPNLFQICIPIFYGGELVIMAAHLRYRLQGGEVLWGYQLAQPDVVFDAAFDDMVKKIDDGVESVVVLGVPERS